MPVTATKSKTSAAKAKARAKAKAKKLPVCTAKDLKTKKAKRRKCRVVTKTTKPATKAAAVTKTPIGTHPSSPTGPAAAPPATSGDPTAWTPLPGVADQRTDGLRTYTGAFGTDQATRLLFRAGFGPLPGQAEAFAALGVAAAVDRLVNPGPAQLVGPAPSGDFLVGGQFAPADKWGHGHLQWLDRIARSTDQLGERMTLVMHDWIAMSAEKISGDQMIASIGKLRNGWRGSFRQLMQSMTIDPGMLVWLDGLDSESSDPNENYGRELMEMFTLGADRGAYTEDDIRENARALTGWVADWSEARGLYNFRFWPDRWDQTVKVLFGGTTYERRGNFKYNDVVDACIDHPLHPSFVALKLWSAFIPTPPTQQTLDELCALYRSSGEQLLPLVQAILLHPDLYTGPSMTKSPVTYAGGLLRSKRAGIDTDAWTWVCDMMGQFLWYPPNVSGWNERAWLNTTTYEGRWYAAQYFVNDGDVPTYEGSTETPQQAVDAALAFWGTPVLSSDHRAMLLQHATDAMKTNLWSDAARRTLRQQTLRMLVVAAPDFQVS
ncbi:MAG: DUF1800 family protein [Solirubrobacteraceae bacterium]|nr:DUF1800 family protein [Patulibacter sp.]